LFGLALDFRLTAVSGDGDDSSDLKERAITFVIPQSPGLDLLNDFGFGVGVWRGLWE